MHVHVTVHSYGTVSQAAVPYETIHTLDGENTWARHMQRLCILWPFSCPQGSNASCHKKYISPGFLCAFYLYRSQNQKRLPTQAVLVEFSFSHQYHIF